MNKNLTKIAALSVSLAMAIGVGVALGSKAVRRVKADSATLQISSAVTADGNITDNSGNTWAVSSDGSYTSNATYIQVGTNKAEVSYLRLVTSAFSTYTISQVQVWGTSKANTNVTPKVIIGSTTIGTGSAYTSQTASTGGTEYSVSNSGGITGNLTIEISRPSSATGAIYFNKAIVTYSSSSTPVLGSPSPVFDSDELEITWANVENATSYQYKIDNGSYTTGTSPVDVSSQSIGSHTFSVIAKASGYDDSEPGTCNFVIPDPNSVPMTPGTNGSEATVNGYDAVKVGTSKNDGDMTITVPSGATKLNLYAAAWKDNSGTVTLSGATVSPSELSLEADDGISNNSPFTLAGDEEDFKFEISLSNITSSTDITIASGTARRFVVWGASYESGPALPEMEIWDTSSVVGANTGYYFSNTSELYEFFAREDGATSSDPAIATATWTSSNTSVATIRSGDDGVGHLTTVSLGETTLTATAEGYETASIKISVVGGPLDSITVSGSMTKTAYTANDASWDPTGLIVTADYWYYEGADVTDEVEWTFVPAVPAEGVTTVVATASFEGETADSDPQAVTVTVAHAGTAEDPFTVAEGIAKAKEIGQTAAGPWVTQGIICKVDEWNSEYPNITYWISDTGFGGSDPTTTIQCHRGKYLEGAAITADNYTEFVVGATVVVTGNLVNYYGNTPEYAANNYPLSLVQPSSGDFDVTFVPPENIEVGDTGLFEATADTTNPEFTWYSSNPAALDVDSSTGAWEALQMGTVRVTVSVVDGDKTGTAFADIVVNGGTLISPAAANSIAASLPDGATTEYYVYVEGYVAEFATSLKDDDPTKPRAFDISTEDETSRIMVYTNVDPYAEFVNGLELGDAIRVKGQIQNYNGKYEIVNPVRTYSEYVALSFAFELLERTGEICSEYDGVTDNHDALELLWGNLAVKYNLLNDAQKNRLMDPESYGMGQTVLDAMERYDYITGKYGLTNFITGRTPTQFVNPVADATNNFNSNSNTMIIVISVIAAVSALSIGVLLVIKKRKHN